MNNFHSMKKYMYGQPLCYQLCSDTENRKTWGNESTIKQFVGNVAIKLITLVGVDKKIEPGYSIYYAISKILPIILLLLSLMVVYIFFTIVSKKYMKKYKIRVNRK